jgi:WXXGXW repeat (2 copies)
MFVGCTSYGPHRHYGPPPASVVYVSHTPPAPRTVIIPPRPTALSVWISGYWDWSGVDFVWIDGHWDRNPPRAGAQWVPDMWIRTDRGWYRHPGGWKDSRGR